MAPLPVLVGLVAVEISPFSDVLLGMACGFLLGFICACMAVLLLRTVQGRGGVRLPPVAPTVVAPAPGHPDWSNPDNAPPAFDAVEPHVYFEAANTPCCKFCGGGKLNPIHVRKHGI